MKNKLRVWPVIHLESTSVALENAELASRAGAYGVFVISMSGDDDSVVPAAAAIKSAFPGLKVGVNHLTKLPAKSLALASAAGLDAMWTDHPGVSSSGLTQIGLDLHTEHQTCLSIQVFASVAFKYQKPEPEPAKAIVFAHQQGWLPTTSGDQTGQAPDPEWVRGLREAIGEDMPLAIASGMDEYNVTVFGPLLSDILVASKISDTFYRFSPEKLKRFMDRSTEAIAG
jgi:predicted TIM-barrel enzyme